MPAQTGLAERGGERQQQRRGTRLRARRWPASAAAWSVRSSGPDARQRVVAGARASATISVRPARACSTCRLTTRHGSGRAARRAGCARRPPARERERLVGQGAAALVVGVELQLHRLQREQPRAAGRVGARDRARARARAPRCARRPPRRTRWRSRGCWPARHGRQRSGSSSSSASRAAPSSVSRNAGCPAWRWASPRQIAGRSALPGRVPAAAPAARSACVNQRTASSGASSASACSPARRL